MTHEPAGMTSVVFDRAADYYDRTRGYPPDVAEQVVALLARAGGLGPTSTVLEVGVGTGRVALPLAAHVRRVVGVDRSRAMLAQLIAKHTRQAVSPLIADGAALPFASGSFEAAFAVHFFHLIADWRGALYEIKRVLAPSGRLLCGQDDQLLPELWDAVYAELPKLENVGVAPAVVDFPTEAGFRSAGAALELRYPQRVPLAIFLRQLEERVWSVTWRMNDAQHAAVVAAMRAAIIVRFGQLDAVTEVERRFTVRVYEPL